jgi:Na+-transporting methylmalonyl-CoA/oxaloacetate decarboxylase gamma subunit
MMLATTWPDAALGIAGIGLVTVVLSILIWQIFATGRTGISAKREPAYRKLAEQATDAQRRTAERLEYAAAELADLRRQTDELGRVLRAAE